MIADNLMEKRMKKSKKSKKKEITYQIGIMNDSFRKSDLENKIAEFEKREIELSGIIRKHEKEIEFLKKIINKLTTQDINNY